MKFTRLSGKSGKDIAFIYKKGGQLQLRLLQNPDRKATILDQPLPGSFLRMQDYQTNGLQVANLDGNNGDEIVTITSDGASLAAYINIFALRNGRIKSILDKPQGYKVGGYKFIVEPARNGASRIAVYTDKEGTKSEIYEWNGKKLKSSKTNDGSAVIQFAVLIPVINSSYVRPSC